jgi:CubicO group peptidase (beta-lactamase class C family)
MKQTIKLSLLCFVLIAGPSLARAQDITQNRRVRQSLNLLEVWLDAERAYEEIPGISAAVVHDQRLLWSKGFGHADVERKAAAKPDTIYSICSISKLFTSISIMQLRDAGKLRLDDPVARHLSWFNIKRTAPETADITIEGLLTHASGLPREAAFPYWTGPPFSFPTREQVMERLSRQETLYPAETFFQYSNLGMTLAGEVTSAASGQPYATYVREHILDPLGLKSTTPEMPESERGRRLATGYSALRRDGARVPVPFFTARGIAPAAGYASTAEDLARFASWQFRVLDRKGGEDVLKSNTLHEMQRIHWVDPDFETFWGLGFSVWRSDNKTFVGHGGSCPGFRTQLLLEPDEKIATVFMANAQGVSSNEFAQRMYEIVSPAIKSATGSSKPTEEPQPADGGRVDANSAAKAARGTTRSGPVETVLPQQESELSVYTGVYESGFAGEMAIVEWEDGLAALGLPTMNPMKGLIKLKKVDGVHMFRRIRKDDGLAETIEFQLGPDGRASLFIWNSNRYVRSQ